MNKQLNKFIKNKLLILSDVDIVHSNKTSSMAIRQRYLANMFSKYFDVSLVSTFGETKQKKMGKINIISGVSNLNFIKNNYDAVLIGLASNKDSVYYKYSKKNFDILTIVDLYYSIIFEKLITIENTAKGIYIFKNKLKVILQILKKGKHYICATPKQRIYLLGMLSALGQIDTTNFNQPFLSIIPTIIDTDIYNYKNLKLRENTLNKKDKIILWLGGIYPWFNPTPLIDAMQIVTNNISNAKLVFIGAKHPTTQYDDYYNEAVIKAKKTGLYKKSIIFLDWVNEAQSLVYTSQVDLNVILSKKSLEDELAYRTRILTPALLGIPTITNGQDYISELIIKNGAGFATNGKSKELAKQITDILNNEKLMQRMKKNTKYFKRDLIKVSEIDSLNNIIKEKSKNTHLHFPPLV